MHRLAADRLRRWCSTGYMLGLVKVSVVFALISVTDKASIIIKISLNKASRTVQCAYQKLRQTITSSGR